MIRELGFDAAYRLLSLQHFPLHENPDRRGFERLSPKELQRLSDWLYDLDRKERIVASCYSVALTMQLMAYAQGGDPELIIGLKKVDEKLMGHAWLDLGSGHLLNPGNEGLDGMAVMKRCRMSAEVDRWVRSACRSG